MAKTGMFENFGLLKKTSRAYYTIGTWKCNKSKYIAIMYAKFGWDRAAKATTATESNLAHFDNFSLLLQLKMAHIPRF